MRLPEMQMNQCSAKPSTTISMPPSRAAFPSNPLATPFQGCIHGLPAITVFTVG